MAGWLLGELLVKINAWLALRREMVALAPSTLPNIIRVTLVFLTIGLLAVVVGGVHNLKLVMRYRRPRRLLDDRIISATAFNTPPLRGEIPYVRSRGAMPEESEVVC